MQKNVFLHGFYLALRSKVGVNVKGQGQGHGSRSNIRSNFWHAAVDIRGSALLSAAKSNKSHWTSYAREFLFSHLCLYSAGRYADYVILVTPVYSTMCFGF